MNEEYEFISLEKNMNSYDIDEYELISLTKDMNSYHRGGEWIHTMDNINEWYEFICYVSIGVWIRIIDE